MAESTIRDYLDNPPYYGKSTYDTLLSVKRLCGPTCSYDPVRKLWGTKCTDALQDLFQSGKWHPVGIERAWKGQFMRAADAYRSQAEAVWVAKRGAEAAAAAEAEAAAAAAAKKRPGSWLIPSSNPKPKKANTAPAPSPARAPAPAAAPAPEQGLHLGVAPNAAEKAECTRMGFTPQAIAYSNSCDYLGPRGTLSNEGRILRWCSFFPMEDDEDGEELDRETRKKSWNVEQRWPLPRRASRAYATELNAMTEASGAALS